MSGPGSAAPRQCGCPASGKSVSKMIDNCCQLNLPPQMLTKFFIVELIQEMTALCISENSQPRIDFITNISKVLSKLAFGDLSGQEESVQQFCSGAKIDIKAMLHHLKRIDDSILELFEKKKACYQLIANPPSYGSVMIANNIQVTPRMDCGPPTTSTRPSSVNQHANNNQQQRPDSRSLIQRPTSQENSNYFGNLTLKAASFCATKPYEFKVEIDMKDNNFKNIELKHIYDHGASHMLVFDNRMLCVSPSNQFYACHFDFTFSLYVPQHIEGLDTFKENIIYLTKYQDKSYIVSPSGYICMCSQSAKQIKSLKIKEKVNCATDLEGVLYVVSVTDKLYTINMRSMTLLREPFQLDENVKHVKIMYYISHLIIMYTTRKGDIIGRLLIDGLPSPVIMKTECPRLECIFFAAVSNAPNLNMVTFFCCTSVSSFGICVLEPFSPRATNLIFQIDGPISAVFKEDNIIFMGSFSGTVVIIDVEKQACYRYLHVLSQPITAFARSGNCVYVSSLLSITCLVFINRELKIK